ncbi:MAG: hypothetical protein K2F81_06590 [Ruminococcus sp.]|nr:hypothetical protein [Ruminococcus sp.]
MRLFHSKESDKYTQEFQLDDDVIEQIDNEFSAEEIVEEPLRKSKHRLRRFIVRFSILCIIIILINIAVLFFTGKLWFNQPDKKDYPIRGALVDSNMGEIRWDVFSRQNISAAYICATKGTSFKDEQFNENWKNSCECELLTGAYHIFKLNTDGKKQGEYFCDAMGDSLNGRLIPAVEVNLTGIYAVASPDKEKTVKRLSEFCIVIEEKYGVKPLIMCTNRSYEKYIQSEFDEYPVCITDVYSEPEEGIDWDFWCYNNRVRVKGYENEKDYFSMFVYKDNIDIDTFKKEYVC